MISGWKRAEVIGRTSDALGLWQHAVECEEFYRKLAADGRVAGAVRWQAISAAVVD